MDAAAVLSAVRTCGLSLQGGAVRAALAFLSAQPSPDDALASLLSALQAAPLTSSVVSAAVLQDAIATLAAGRGDGEGSEGDDGGGGDDGGAGRLVFVDAFALPRHGYDSVRRVFHRLPPLPLLAPPSAKPALVCARLALVQQRLARNRLFSRPALGAASAAGAAAAAAAAARCELAPLSSLLGAPAGKGAVLLGVLAAPEGAGPGCGASLEDGYGAVPLAVPPSAQQASGLATDGAVVLAEGALGRDGVFEVRALGFPPMEPRADAVAALGGLDMWGAAAAAGGSGGAAAAVAAPASAAAAAAREAAAAADAAAMWVLLADVACDTAAGLARLSAVLGAFESAQGPPPGLFLLAGDFVAEPFGPATPSLAGVRAAFASLAATLARFPRLLARSTFAFVPGPGDAGPSAPLPHPPLPASLTRPLRALLHPSRAVWASNPARLRWRGRDFVFCRAEIGGALRRACARPPPDRPPPAAGSAGSAGSAAEDAFADVVATVLQQGHLLPVAPGGGAGGGGGGAAPPVWWGADCGLWLHPPPHGLVLMDRGAGQAACAFGGVACCSPGSFGGQGAFAVLRPAGPTFELSALP